MNPVGENEHTEQVKVTTLEEVVFRAFLLPKAFETGCYWGKFTEHRRLKVRDIFCLLGSECMNDICHVHIDMCSEPEQFHSLYLNYLYYLTETTQNKQKSVSWYTSSIRLMTGLLLFFFTKCITNVLLSTSLLIILHALFLFCICMPCFPN